MFAKQVYVMSTSVLIPVLGAIGIAAAIGPGREGDAVKADLMKLEGTWRMVGVEIGDKSVNLKDRYEQIFITGNKITVKSGFRVTDFQFTINPSKMPKWIDATYRTGGQGEGIYELKGDTLRLFFGQKGERPTEFKTKDGTQQAIQTFERVKVDPDK
jgi:uncharacterized protein (TIGR03067 family)